MEGHTTALTALEVGDGAAVPRQLGKTTGACSWKLCGAVVLAALCGTAALLFFCHSLTQAQGIETNGHHQHLKQIQTNVRAAIHLHGEFNPKIYNSTMLWRDGDGHSFFQGGLKLKNNEIIIPQNGLYFVYSQVSFQVQCSSTVRHMSRPIAHMIMRWSDSYNGQKPLLSAVQTVCQRNAEGSDRSQSWYNAVYLGAVFSLEGEDRLWTETNQLKDVVREDGKTFFGVFAL